MPLFCLNLFGDNWGPAFFGALTSVGALFVFTEKNKGEKIMRKHFSIILMILVLVFALASCDTVKGMIIKHEVTFNLDGGVAGEGYAESVEIGDGQALALTTPTREGYNFLGWYSGETKITDSTPITSDMSLTAKWEIKSFKVTFLDYYGNTASTQNVNYGESATAPTVDNIIEKKRFDGWSADFSNVTEDMTVNAIYVDNTYTITYDLGDKDNSFDEPCFYGELPKIPAAPNVEGYVFSGWFFDEELTDRYFFDYELDRDITLYARFYDISLGEYIVISNVDQLKAIADQPDAKYLLACDINCHGEMLTPINSFSGELDGNGYKIYNFNITETSVDRGGFIRVSSGVIKNLSFDDFIFKTEAATSGDLFLGVVVGYLTDGQVANCHILDGVIQVSGAIKHINTYLIGGIVGYAIGESHIDGCSNFAEISINCDATYDKDFYLNVGGIVGRIESASASVSNCNNYAEINTHMVVGAKGEKRNDIGGIIGWNVIGEINNCYNSGNVTVKIESIGKVHNTYTMVGGAVGYNSGNFNNSYSTGEVTKIEINDYDYADITTNYAGGFVGYNNGNIYNCYSTGNVSQSPSKIGYIGGFVGYNCSESGKYAIISKCFSTGNVGYNTDISNSEAICEYGYFAGSNTGNIKDCYYDDSAYITHCVVDGSENPAELIPTNTIGEAKAFDELTSVEFLENTLYFDRMIWLVVEGQLPTLR